MSTRATCRRWLLVTCGLWLAASPVRAGEPADVLPVQGPAYRASLVQVDADWQVVLDVGGERRAVPAAQLVAWGEPAEANRGPQIVLSDGSLLVADIVRGDDQNLLVDSAALGEVALPLPVVAGIIWNPPAAPGERDRLIARLMPPSTGGDAPRDVADSDTLILENGDEISGAVQKLGDTGVDFVGDVGPVQIERSRIAAVVMNPVLLRRPPRAGLWALIGCKDGSLLAVQTLTLDEQQAQLTLGDGTALACASREVVFFQIFGGQARYLSDRESESYKHIPFLSLHWPFHVDKNVTGGQLRAGGRRHIKGVGMHSAARLTYRLQKSDRQFQAELAVDDNAQGRGSVVFRVFVDERERFRSEVVRGGDPPTPITVDVRGGKRLSLIVDFAERSDELDHANWLNARLTE